MATWVPSRRPHRGMLEVLEGEERAGRAVAGGGVSPGILLTRDCMGRGVVWGV